MLLKISDNIPDEIFIPAESVLYPLWDVASNNFSEDQTEITLPFRGGTVKIENTSKEYPGLLGELEFTIYMHFMVWSNQERVEKGEFASILDFPLKKLIAQLGYDTDGGKLYKDLINSIHRLLYTFVRTDVRLDPRKRFLDTFNLLSGVRVYKDGDEYQCQISFYPHLVLDRFVIEGNKPAVMLEGQKLSKIEKSLDQLIYTRLQRHIKAAKKAKQNSLTLTYDFLVNNIFTGFVKRKYLSDVKQQLSKTFNRLVKAGVFSGFNIYKDQKNQIKIDFILKPVKSSTLGSSNQSVKSSESAPISSSDKNQRSIYDAFIKEVGKL